MRSKDAGNSRAGTARFGARPSPAIVVAALALVAALVGTAVAAPVADVAVSKKKVKKIADKRIAKKAPGLSVDNAENLGGIPAGAYQVDTGVASSTALPGFQSTSTTAVDIPGATTSVDVPQGQDATLLVNFSAISLCRNATFGFNCPIRILVDGETADPTPDPSGYIFDTTAPVASAPNQALSLTVSKSVGAGTHDVKVVYGGGVAGTTFTVRTWHLSAQAFPGA